MTEPERDLWPLLTTSLRESLRPRPLPPPGRRIVVVGSSGAGKSTLARSLAARLDLDHIELDAESWLPGWRQRPSEQLRQRVARRISGDRWVVDGNYESLHDLVLPAADTLVWLDHSLPTVLWRVVRRTVARAARRELLWGTNRESFVKAFSRDSIVLWSLATWAGRRARYSALVETGKLPAHLTCVHVRSRRAARAWLAIAGRTSQGPSAPHACADTT